MVHTGNYHEANISKGCYMSAFTQMFSGKDNKTIDLGRVLWAKLVLVFAGATIYAIIEGQTFDPALWGVGAGAVLAAGGAGIAAKAKTEPEDG